MNGKRVDIHADDYGYSLKTSQDMLECMEQGALDSFSIICNLPAFIESMDLLYKKIPSLPFLPAISVHLDLPEGIGVTDLLPISWGRLFLWSYLPFNGSVKEKLEEEIRYQIERTWAAVERCLEIAKENNVPCHQKGLRIDSHIHTHPLPIVWDALIDVLIEDDYQVEYIRNPKEPLLPFLKQRQLLSSYGIMNIVKNRILQLYSGKIDRYCEYNKIGKMYMWGLTMSGHMDYDRIKALYPAMYEKAEDDGRTLELLFHPGKADPDEYAEGMDPAYFRDANTSENRHIEKDAVMKMKQITDRS